MHENTADCPNLVNDASLVVIRWLWKEYLVVQAPVRSSRIVRFVFRFGIISRTNLGKVYELRGYLSALFDAILYFS